MIKPIKEYEVEIAKNQDTGEDLPRMMTFHVSRRLGDFSAFMNNLGQNVNGIDAAQQVGPYSFSIITAVCFDPEEIKNAIVEIITSHQGGIQVPSGPRLITP